MRMKSTSTIARSIATSSGCDRSSKESMRHSTASRLFTALVIGSKSHKKQALTLHWPGLRRPRRHARALRSRRLRIVTFPAGGRGCYQAEFDRSHKVHNQTVDAVINRYLATEIRGEHFSDYLRAKPSSSRGLDCRAVLFRPGKFQRDRVLAGNNGPCNSDPAGIV